MMRRFAIPLGLLAWVAALSAQDTSLTAGRVTPSSPIIHWGKWVTLGAALGLTVAAVVQHDHAQDRWNELQALCRDDNQACALTSSGTYDTSTPNGYQAELLYEETVYYDHLARRRLVLGQVSLLASVGMFVLEFKRRQLAPPNIPLHGLRMLIEPTGGAGRGGARFGFTLTF